MELAIKQMDLVIKQMDFWEKLIIINLKNKCEEN